MSKPFASSSDLTEKIETLEILHAEYGRALRARDFSAVHAVNDAFHLALFRCCGNDYLVDSIRHYMWLSLPVRAKKTADLARAMASERDHYLMIQLLKGTDNWALAQLCVDHVQPAKTGYLDVARQEAPAGIGRPSNEVGWPTGR